MSYRDKYFSDYEAVKVPANNKKGYKIQYDYIGNWCVWNESPAEFNKRKRTYIAVGCFSALLLIVCGIQRVTINTNGFVAIPGLVALVSLMYAAIGTVQICMAGLRVQEKDRKGMSTKFSVGHAVSAVSLFVCAIAGIIVLFVNGITNIDLGSLFVVIGYLIAATCSYFLYKYHKTLSFYMALSGKTKSENINESAQ